MDYRPRLSREVSLAEEIYEWAIKSTSIQFDYYHKIQCLYFMLKADVELSGEDNQRKDHTESGERESYDYEIEVQKLRFDMEIAKKDIDIGILSGMCSAYREVIRMLMEQICLDAK